MDLHIHPHNFCPPVSYSELLGSDAYAQSYVSMAWNNPRWGASPSQARYIHPSSICTPVSYSGPLGSEAYSRSYMCVETDPGWFSDPEWGSGSELSSDPEWDTTPSLAKYIKGKIEHNLSPERIINLFHCLIELGDNSLVEKVQRYLNSGNLSAKDLSPAQYSALAFVMLMSNEELDVFDLKKYIRSDKEHWRLLPVVKKSRTALLNRCDLIDQHCEVLISALRSNSSPLRDLDLSNNDLQDSGVKLLSTGLGDSHCKLEILRLSGCKVTEEGCSSLASALRSKPSLLRDLDLSNNDLQDSGVKLLSTGLGDSHCKLEILRLSGCRVTEEGCSSLASALRSKPSHLRDLDLSNNDLQDSGTSGGDVYLGVTDWVNRCSPKAE
nr:ribonuclease inhibitor-like [Paramormyrops kingsleyae]